MTLMDWYSAGFSLFIVALLEVTIIMYRYGKFARSCSVGGYHHINDAT